MMAFPSWEWALVIDQHTTQFRVAESDGRSMDVSVSVDGDPLGTWNEPSWAPVSIGVANGSAYWWSARRVVSLARGEASALEFESDEDIHWVFYVSGHWLTICETSIRLYRSGVEVDRIEFAEVISAVRWDGPQLHATDQGGKATLVELLDGQLIVRP